MGCWSGLKAWYFAVFLMCGVLSMCGGCGCGKTKEPPLPEVYTDRANDAAYLESLLKMRERQIEVAEVEMEIAKQMTQHVERVKAAFPQGVGEDQLQAALAADAQWQELDAKAKAQAALSQKVWEECRESIRNRILEQMQAEQDVKDGKARSVDKPLNWPPAQGADERKKE